MFFLLRSKQRSSFICCSQPTDESVYSLHPSLSAWKKHLKMMDEGSTFDGGHLQGKEKRRPV